MSGSARCMVNPLCFHGMPELFADNMMNIRYALDHHRDMDMSRFEIHEGME